MREIKIYCDHCGKVLDYMEDYEDTTIEGATKEINADLCAECADDLDRIIETFCNGLKFKQSQEIK